MKQASKKGGLLKGRFILGVLLVLATLLALDFGFTGFAKPAAPQQMTIDAINLDTSKGIITINGLGRQDKAGPANYTALKLPNPYRLILDIPDAVNGINRDSISIQKQGVEKITLTQHSGPFYNAVRVTIFVNNAETLRQLNTTFAGDQLQIHLTPSSVAVGPEEFSKPPAATPTMINSDKLSHDKPGPTPMVKPWEPPVQIPANRNIVEDVFYRDHQLRVQAGKGGTGKIKVKNQFVLNDPQRLVIDLDNTAVASKAVLGTIDVNNDPLVKRIRVGQFDEETVRLVIEASNPERFSVFYPSADERLLAVSAMNNASIVTLPRGTPLGALERITIDQENGATVIRLSTSSPLVHQIAKQGDKINIDLLNIAARPGSVSFDEKAFSQIDAMSVDPLVVGQPNSRFVIDLDKANWEVNTRLSADNQMLEIALTAPTFRIGQATKLSFPARVVVDAGHGGKDKGAMRQLNGQWILEKDLNLAMALKVRKALEDRGVTVIMTRSTDEFLPLPTISEISNRNRPDVFVSVHHNASTNPGLSGIETYYYQPYSKPLADKIHHYMVNSISSSNRGVRRARFYVINHTIAPSVLCEVGYVSNNDELSELVTAARQNAAANAIAEGVVKYLQSKVAAFK